MLGKGLKDIAEGFKSIDLALYLAYSDIRQRYRRSSLGPFWITISTGVMIASMGLIFGRIFKAPTSEFFPFLAAGLIFWGFISGCISESTTVFPSNEAVIKQLPIPLFVHILRMIARNLFIFAHNFVLLPFVLLCVERPITINIIFLLPGLILLLLNLLWFTLILATVCARFRDMTQIVQSVMQIVFYVTPIIWMPNLLQGKTETMLIDPNPFYHLIQLVRAPITGHSPTSLTWVYTTGICIFGWFLAIKVFNRYKSKVAYWL